MKALLTTICIFLSVSTFLKKAEMQRIADAEQTYVVDGEKYDVLQLKEEALTDLFFKRIANSSEENAAEMSAFVLVKDSNGEDRYFAVPLENETGIQDFIKTYAKPKSIESKELNSDVFDSPLAYQGN